MYKTTTADWAQLENGKKHPDVSFARLAAANVHYGAFGELLEGPLPVKVIDKASDKVVETHHGRYGELVEGPRPSFQVRTDFDTDAVDVDGEDPSGEMHDDGEEGDDGRGEDEQADDDHDGYDSASDPQPDVDSDVDIAKPEAEKGVGADCNDVVTRNIVTGRLVAEPRSRDHTFRVPRSRDHTFRVIEV